MGSNRYNNQEPTKSELKAHIEDKTIHPRIGSTSGMLALPENQTYRGNASNLATATSVLKINATGPENTVDHSTGTSPRIVNVVYVASPGSLVDATTVPEGTLGIIYTP